MIQLGSLQRRFNQFALVSILLIWITQVSLSFGQDGDSSASKGRPPILESTKSEGSSKEAKKESEEMLSKEAQKEIRYVCYAAFVGVLGSGAFFCGVYTGFISRDSRKMILEFLVDFETPQNSRLKNQIAFFVFGGVVAGVFQWAQPGTFAPIQAFVLGATWPSVVTRIMSGEGRNPQPDMRNPPPPPHSNQPPVEVVIGAREKVPPQA